MSVAKPIQLSQHSAEDPSISPLAARRLIRAGIHTGHTAGMALGRLQGNLAILPKGLALEFAIFLPISLIFYLLIGYLGLEPCLDSLLFMASTWGGFPFLRGAELSFEE